MNVCSKARLRLIFISLSVPVSLIISPVFATQTNTPVELQSHKLIIDASRQFLDANIDTSQYSRITIKMGRLDPRLRLSKCEIPLTATQAAGSRFSGKTTVHISCSGKAPWTAFVTAQISLYANVIKTAQPLRNGHILRKSDLIESEEDLSRIKYGYFTDPKNLIGKELKRRLAQNRVIKANYVKAATLVKRGERVSIVAETTRYSVKMTGTAMMNGARGDRIRVKNLSSKRVIEGTVKAPGIVSIN
ncbi:hypothetical protein MNBD_GAMMA09-91 [hydrothermal vent metagenome]|uniref:SAF domain-containing protein n=1 Tax=hydrothermal vent metagenome TaxID=652676 RepID=A0A3B0XRD0_9ZZZZ